MVDEIVIFTSDDEEDDGKKSVRLYTDVLRAKVITLHGHGHFTQRDMGTEKFPALLAECLGGANPFAGQTSEEAIDAMQLWLQKQ